MNSPLIAIVGRPNVGKSTFFNRLVGGRPALVHDTPGLTRDRRYGELEYFTRQLRIIDTGGLDPEAEKEVIGAGIHRQAQAALAEADAIIVVIDARAGVNPLDTEVASLVRKLGKPTFLVANKVDSEKNDALVHDLHSLGLGTPWPVSAAHGRGIDDLLQEIVDVLELPLIEEPEVEFEPFEDEVEDDEGEDIAKAEEEAAAKPLRITFIGKPNAGKSSLVNRLLGVERSLVHNEPGTTTDPVDTEFELGGNEYILVDTAGIRRRNKVGEDTEKISISLAVSQLRRADVVILVVDGNEKPSEQDARLAGLIEESGRALVIALNKADLLKGAGAKTALSEKTRDELHFLSYAPIHYVSALRGDGVGELMDIVQKVAREHRRRVPTAELNRFFAEVIESHPPPSKGNRVVRIHYIVQARSGPPTFLLFANHPSAIDKSYNRYVANQLRERYGFKGTPLRVFMKAKSPGRRGPTPGKKGKAKVKAKGSGRSQNKRGQNKRR